MKNLWFAFIKVIFLLSHFVSSDFFTECYTRLFCNNSFDVKTIKFNRFHNRKTFYISCFFQTDSRTIAPKENCPPPPTPKLTLTKTLTLTGGQFFPGTIVWLSLNPKTNPNFDQNPKPNRGQFSWGEQLSGYLSNWFDWNVK